MDEEHSYSVKSGCLTGNGDIKWKNFDCVVQTFMKEQGIPGASVAICRNQEILYTQGYGIAGASKRVQPDSLFRIASISKPIAAFVILHICIDYNVSLDSKVFGKKGILKTYKYKDKRVPSMTIRHLLQHSAGWDRDIAGDLAFVRPASVTRCHPESVEHNHALVSYVLKKRLQFKPGTRHAYSNLCYLVLGLVIEEISGLSFASYLAQVLERWDISDICLGGPWRAEWTSTEVEYFNNREPAIVQSLHSDFGDLVPQYGGLAMGSAAAYGGLIANGTCLLRFLNIIENIVSEKCEHQVDMCNSNKEFVDVTGDIKMRNNYVGNISVISTLVKESLRKPDYENGVDWYGLGWDVGDKGQSWGHTGGMEGTSGVLFHHVSGLSWVLLLNAWAKDIDLNGVMKCAISCVPNLKLFNCDIIPMEIEASKECENLIDSDSRNRILFTKDNSQVILLGVDETRAFTLTLSLKARGYMLTWINVLQNELDFSFTASYKENVKKILSTASTKLTYILLFSLQKQKQYDDYVLILNKSKDELLSLTTEKENVGYVVDFVDSFCNSDGNVRFSAVLMKGRSCDIISVSERSLHLAIKAGSYIRLIKTWVKSQCILCQSVTEANGELYVSVLLENRTSMTLEKEIASSYWVQIEPESFLTELNRKIKQNMTLTYAKFFNADGQPWVSGCWRSSHATNIYHRITMSKYGLFPELADAAAENVRLLSVSEYDDDGVVYYAGLWTAS